MALTASARNNDIEPIPAGVHRAVCYGVVDLGNQKSIYNNKEKIVHKVLVMWELPDERIKIKDEEKPRIVNARYTLSLGKKATLKSILESWRGRPFTKEELNRFDMRNMIGANCQLNIIHNEKDGETYANVSSVIPLPKGTPKLAPESDVLWYSMEESMEFPSNMPDWVKETIKKSQEWNAPKDSKAQDAADIMGGSFVDDETPF